MTLYTTAADAVDAAHVPNWLKTRGRFRPLEAPPKGVGFCGRSRQASYPPAQRGVAKAGSKGHRHLLAGFIGYEALSDAGCWPLMKTCLG